MRNRTYTFGPGYHESLVLTASCRRKQGDSRQISLRLTGTVPIYCGFGWEHTANINVETSVWTSEKGELSRIVAEMWENFDAEVDGKYRIAAILTEEALEDWYDPCEMAQAA